MAARFPILIVLFVALLTFPGQAFAQRGGDVSDSIRFQDELNPNEFMITARMRAVAVPGFVLGLFFDEYVTHWSDGHRNFSYGGEFVWRRGTDFELGMAVDYADLSMPEGFWLEADQSAQSADWTAIDLQVLSVVFSAYWFWNVTPWFTPYIGGGIGPGFVLGDVIRYQPNRDSACYRDMGGNAAFTPPECFRPDGSPDPDAINYDDPEFEDRIPPVVPILNLTVGTRFNIANNLVFKVEGGFYDYFFAGVALGAQF